LVLHPVVGLFADLMNFVGAEARCGECLREWVGL
jgi:bacterioferritin-associated ferredoxin